MATIETGSEHAARAVNQSVPLIPFIDLLFCTIMFLLATAVWNQLERVNANQRTPGPDTVGAPHETIRLQLSIGDAGYTLASNAGESVELARRANQYDHVGLNELLQQQKRLSPNDSAIVVAADDGVRYSEVIAAMDIAIGAEFTNVTLGGDVR